MTKKIVHGLGWTLFIACVIAGLKIRLDNPELTETQLMVVFWKEWLLLGVLMIKGVLATRYK